MPPDDSSALATIKYNASTYDMPRVPQLQNAKLPVESDVTKVGTPLSATVSICTLPWAAASKPRLAVVPIK